MKKNLCLLLALVMIMATMTACGSTAKPEPAPAAEPAVEEAAVEEVPAAEADGSVPQPAGYPSKPITWIVPAAAGVAIDLPTRALVDCLDLGQPVVVENIAGASQTLGTAEAAARDADGYTILTMGNACGITQPLMSDLAYSLDDFRFIAMITPPNQSIITVRPDSPIQDLDDLVEFITTSDDFVFGVPNSGFYGQIAICQMFSQLGVYDKAISMVYSGSNENITAIMNGEVDFGCSEDTDVVPRVANGELRPIAVLSDEPDSRFPDLPYISQIGITDVSTFKGLKWVAVRKDTPAEIVDWLKQEINAAIESEKFEEWLKTLGFSESDFTIRTEEEISALLDTAAAEYGGVMKTIGMIQ